VSVGAAHASSTTTKLHFTETLSPSEKLGSGHFDIVGSLTNRKVASSGKPAGYVSYACTLVTASVYRCNAAFTLAGGILLSHETLNFAKSKVTGTITGGDGKFSGARGTVKLDNEDTGVTIVDLIYTKK
jgi:hypothetical protein